jgi:predicted ATPase
MNAPLHLRTLGRLVLEGAAIARPKPLLLLAYLTIEGPKDRRHVAELFWPHASEAMNSLRVALVQLRSGAPGALDTDGVRLTARTQADVSDVLRRLDAGDLARGVDAYPGAFLEGFHLPGTGAELEEWIVGTREYVADKVQEAYLRLAEADAAACDFAAAVARAELALLVPGAAEPAPEVLERLHTVLVAGGSLRARDLRKDAASFGIDLHLTRAEARSRLSPATRSAASATRAIPHNLRARTGSFIGRDPERIDITQLLADADVRIVTLTGQAGAGKSRLALEVAFGELRDAAFPDGVFFVPLDAIDDPELVPAAIAAAMGEELPGRKPAVDELAGAIAAQRLLLVLDNFEQLLHGAALVSELVARCPHLVTIVTCRERLNLEGEHRFAIEGLPVPDETLTLTEAPYQDAVKLFVARGRRVRTDFRLSAEDLPHVVTICRLVGGLPLGIELAAAWVRVLPPAEIASEMARNLDFLDGGARDRPLRHRSLRAAFEHAWGLLGRDEQVVLRRSSVFSGGFTREHASRVSGATIPVLASLADASLLRVVGDGRFVLHPLLHHFAREKLAADPEERRAVRLAHADHFAGFAERAEAALTSALQAEWLQRLDEDHDNLRAALRRCVADGDALLALRIVGALWRFWRVRGGAAEARTWYQQALALPGGTAPTRERAKALAGAGVLAFAHGDYDEAAALHAEALTLRRSLGDAVGTAESLHYLGSMKAVVGQLDEARRLFHESVSAFRGLGDTGGLATSLVNLGRLLGMQGDLVGARAALEESLAIRRTAGDELGTAEALGRLGTVARREGDPERALSLWRAALAIRHRLGARAVIPIALDALAGVLAARGDVERAGRLWGASERLRESIGAPLAADVRTEYEHAIALARELDEERLDASWRAGRDLEIDAAVAEALGGRDAEAVV